MKIEKFYPVIDTNREKGQHLINYIQQKLLHTLVENPAEADAILIGWGDGYFMHTIKKYLQLNKPFYGINCGTVWFLLNNFEEKPSFPKQVDSLTLTTLKAKIIKTDGKGLIVNAINDLVIGNTLWDYVEFTIFWKTYKWTGLVLTTPVGSTAYWKSLRNDVLPLTSTEIWLAGIAVKDFHSFILPRMDFDIKVTSRSQVNVAVDWKMQLIKDIHEIKLYKEGVHYNLLFDNLEKFQQKRSFT